MLQLFYSCLIANFRKFAHFVIFEFLTFTIFIFKLLFVLLSFQKMNLFDLCFVIVQHVLLVLSLFWNFFNFEILIVPFGNFNLLFLFLFFCFFNFDFIKF